MPIFDLRCSICGREFEQTITYEKKITGKNLGVHCPKCNSTLVQTIIKTSNPVIYKGEGFTKRTAEGKR
jgi:putative FmdB family regulatory protein